MYPLERYASDCDRCRGEAPASLTVTYDKDAFSSVRREALAAGPSTLWRWAPFLPLDAREAVYRGLGPFTGT